MPSSNRPTIRVNCPQCLAQLDIDSQQAGQRAECPQCHFSLMVPAAGTAGASLFDDLLEPNLDRPPTDTEPNNTSEPSTSRNKTPRSSSMDSELIPDQPEHANPLLADFDFEASPVGPEESPGSEFDEVDEELAPLPFGGEIDDDGDDEIKPGETHDVVSTKPASQPALYQSPKPKKPVSDQIDDDLELDLQLAPLNDEPIDSPEEIDPLQIDAEAPIRVEGIESGDVGAGSIPVKCRVCESVLHAAADKLGKKVVCPDCGSKVLVVKPPKPKGEMPEWAKPNQDWKAVRDKRESDQYRLAVNVDETEVPVEKDWGLPNQEEYVMQPLPALEPIRNEDGEDILEGAPTTRRVDPERIQSAPFVGGKRAAEEQTRKRTKNPVPTAKRPAVKSRAATKNFETDPDERDDREPSRSRENRGAKGNERDPVKTGYATVRDRLNSVDAVDDESPAATGERWTAEGRYIIKLEELGAYKGALRGWLKEVVKDHQLWIRAAVPVVCFGFTYWMGSILVAALHAKNMNGAEQAMQIVFPGVFGGICLIAGGIASLMTGSLIFQQSGDRRPRISEWPGFGIGEWGGSALFWGFGLWLGAMPGMMAGMLFAFYNLAGLSLVIAALSAVVLSPPLLLSAWYNGSAFKVYSSDVFKHFRGRDTDWIRYLPGSIASWLLIAIGYAVLWIPIPMISFVGAMIQVAGILLFATTSGLYCGLMARKIERSA